MPNFREYALTAYAQWEQDQRAQEAAALAALVNRAKTKAAPLFRDATATLVVEPTKVAADANPQAGLVVLSLTDGSDIHLAVYPDTDRASVLVRRDGEAWVDVREVRSLADVGSAVVEGVV